jgi:hypothetical protein
MWLTIAVADHCREQSDGLYRVSTYLIFKLIEEFVVAFINSLVFCESTCCSSCCAVLQWHMALLGC